MKTWNRWVQQPQALWIRRVVFQIHLWCGIGIAVYVFVVCLTGSVLVYRNELYRAVTPAPVLAVGEGTGLTDEQLTQAAQSAYPGFQVTSLSRARNPNQAVFVTLKRGPDEEKRLFDPFTGGDVGAAVPRGIRFMSWLLSLHDNLLNGRTGRMVNGFGGLLLVLLAVTGAIVWWPGVRKWRYNLALHRNVGWRRFVWELHGALGFWTVGFVLLFGITGAFLGLQTAFSALADVIEPPTDENLDSRVVDTAMYWLAYLHFGRFGGRLPGCGATCNSTLKAVWALFGLAPAVLAATGTVMWWNRVIRRGVTFRAGKA